MPFDHAESAILMFESLSAPGVRKSAARELVLMQLVRATCVIYLVVQLLRTSLLPRSGAFGIMPAGMLPALLIILLIMLPWQRWLTTPRSIRAYLWLAQAALSAIALWLNWTTGVLGWWIFPLMLSLYAPALVSLGSPGTPSASPWALNRAQILALAGWALVWAALWWTTLNGPGQLPHEAMLMARETVVTLYVTLTWYVLLQARMRHLPLDRTRLAFLSGYLIITTLFIIPHNAFHGWLMAHSRLVVLRPVSVWTWPVIVVVAGLLWKFRRSARVVPITVSFALIWSALPIAVNPALAFHIMPVMAILWTWLVRPERWLIAVLGWSGTVLLYLWAPGLDRTQVLLHSLSGTAVFGLSMLLLRQLSRAEQAQDQPAAPALPEPALSAATARWTAALSLAVGVLTPLIGISAAGAPSVPYMQAMVLLGLLFGLGSYAGARYWSEQQARQRIFLEFDHLRQSDTLRRQLELAMRSTGLGRFEMDRHKGSVTWDAQAAAVWGFPEYSQGHTLPAAELLQLLHPDDRHLLKSSWQLPANANGVNQLQFRIFWRDGSEHWLSAEFIQESDAQGELVRRWGFIRDITPDKLREQAMAQALETAEAATQAKSAFLATMSHEIRTPLNALIGTAYLLNQTELSDAQRADLATIESSGKSLLALINDILDFSKIEAGELVIDPHPFALPDVLRDLRLMFVRLTAEKGIGLDMPELPDAELHTLVGDGNRLRQCLINLLSNAIKFTRHGRVGLEIEWLPEQAEAGTAPRQRLLRFTVSDSGIGMTPEQLARLFKPFSQADTSTTRRYGGTGLGLSIVKRLAELMGGRVGVASVVGQGSRFWIELPLQVADAALPAPSGPHGATGQAGATGQIRPLHILVAEDNDADRTLLVRMASAFGWEVEGTHNGHAMVERVVHRLQQGHPVDCIVLDWRMPTLDGLAALAELRQRVPQHTMPSVVMVTAADAAELQAAVRQHTPTPPDSILTKPVEPSTLFNAVNEAAVAHGFERNHVLAGTQLGAGQGQWLPGVRVLVVDDSRLNLEVIGRVLAIEGAQPTLRESGEAALDSLRAQPDGFDLVLMDLQMPGLDGCDTTRLIRLEPRWARLPVIALTAGATATEQQRARDAGMDDFLMKPIDPAKLVRSLRQHIERSQGRTLPVAPVADEVRKAAAPVP
ncbi:MAG: hypothetical protein RJA44_2152, partial [Pseudomonadota bacterium]